jgi:hypothetical protein
LHLVERTIFGHASERLEPRHHWSRPWFRFAPAHLRRAEGRAISRNDQRCPRSGPSARADLRVRGQTSAAPPSYLEGVDRGARGRLASGSSVTITTRPIALTFFWASAAGSSPTGPSGAHGQYPRPRSRSPFRAAAMDPSGGARHRIAASFGTKGRAGAQSITQLRRRTRPTRSDSGKLLAVLSNSALTKTAGTRTRTATALRRSSQRRASRFGGRSYWPMSSQAFSYRPPVLSTADRETVFMSPLYVRRKDRLASSGLYGRLRPGLAPHAVDVHCRALRRRRRRDRFGASIGPSE